MSGSEHPPYSVVITTFRRPRAAIAAARSVLEQEGAPEFELIIVDNDPDGSALKPARRLASGADTPVRVVHERRMGLASARNAGVRASKGEFIAFIDDNQTASARWLSQLARVQEASSAAIVFGAIHAELTDTGRRHRRFYESFFARDPDYAEGPVDEVFDCRCSLIARDVLSGDAPFSFNFHDERDAVDPVLVRAQTDGRKIAWAASAWVWQTPQREQLSMRYALRSAYNLSRERRVQLVRGERRRALRALAGVGTGVLQAGAYAPVAFAMWCLRSEKRGFAYRRLAEGLGRAFWPSAFRLRGPDLELAPVAG